MTILHAALSFSDYTLGKSEVLLMSDVSARASGPPGSLGPGEEGPKESYLMGRGFIGVPRLAVI